MTPRERAGQIQWVGKTPKELWDEIEQAINAAVLEERERCEEVLNRTLDGLIVRERQAINEAVEEEREACAKVAEGAGPKFYHKAMSEAADSIATQIRARSIASSASQED